MALMLFWKRQKENNSNQARKNLNCHTAINKNYGNMEIEFNIKQSQCDKS